MVTINVNWLALFLIVAVYLAFASGKTPAWIKRHIYRRRERRAVLMMAALLIPYVLVTLPSWQIDLGVFARGLLAMAAYIFIPGALAIYRSRAKTPSPKPLDLADVLIILIVWLPLEFDWLPRADVILRPDLFVPIPLLTGAVLLLLIFFVFRPLPTIGYTFSFTGRDIEFALKAFALYAVIAVPVGLLIGFLRWNPPARMVPEELVLRFVGIFLLVGLPEELLFRGVIQNLVEKRNPRERNAALVIASIIFGAAHLNNPPAPNYLYMLMATGAGVAYGWVWARTRKVTAAALTHTLIDWVWALLLGG
ncbi:MAG: CPBP family intramembrane metalloprotease [Anaerolineae bacterium]|nr:CPBP family intramembrane metalloprotease [Anaerolineae bacterium]